MISPLPALFSLAFGIISLAAVLRIAKARKESEYSEPNES